VSTHEKPRCARVFHPNLFKSQNFRGTRGFLPKTAASQPGQATKKQKTMAYPTGDCGRLRDWTRKAQAEAAGQATV
jgi:hypothetical protein